MFWPEAELKVVVAPEGPVKLLATIVPPIVKVLVVVEKVKLELPVIVSPS
jgi:hypothetical protein